MVLVYLYTYNVSFIFQIILVKNVSHEKMYFIIFIQFGYKNNEKSYNERV